MTVKDNPFQAATLLAIFAGLEATVIQRYETRSQDLHLLKHGLWLVLLMALLPTPKAFKIGQTTSHRFQRQFAILSFCEVVFTIVLPWLLLLRHGGQATSMVPHLLIFQGQILAELVLFLVGHKEWLFAFTCVANTCRFRSILAGVQGSDESLNKALSIIALLLWLYSSFVFIPFVWYRQGSPTLAPK
jgi:hypothetical protein